MKVRSYYTRPAYTSDTALRLRRSRMQPMGRRDIAVRRLSIFFHKGPRRRTRFVLSPKKLRVLGWNRMDKLGVA